MPLTPQQLADFQRLRQSYAPVVEAQRRKQQAQANLEKMHGLPPVKPQPKAKGGEVLYHGTPHTKTVIKRFQPKGGGDFGAGIYMTTSPHSASEYSKGIQGNQHGAVYPLIANIKNPLKIKDKYEMNHVYDSNDSGKPIHEYLQSKGYDGIHVTKPNEDSDEQYFVAFHPKQVKSSITGKAKGGKIEVRPTVFDDAASRRNPKIEEAARALLAGNIKQKDYEKLVAKEKPVKPYSFIPKPATDEQAMKVLIDRQKQNWRSHENWPAGHPVGLRLDIPAYERHGVWVNSVHDESGQKPAFPTSYGPVSSVRNAEFHGSPHKAARVATGEQSKTPFARIMGNIEHMDEEQAVKHFQKYMNHPDYRQIGYDPRRHGDFYDRETMQPVTHSEHVVQIGPLVLAKKPKYGKRTVYAKGGKVTHAHHLEIEERPL